MKEHPTQERIQEILEYRDGSLFWKIKVRKNMAIGSLAGIKTDRYRRIKIDGKQYDEHRIIWIYHYGAIPEDMVIDHINRDIIDNRIENLRIATYSTNGINRTGGNVHFLENRNPKSKNYLAYVSIDGKRVSKCFYTEREAIEWVTEKKKELLDNCYSYDTIVV